MPRSALDRHALEPPMPRPLAAVARHRPGLVALVALIVPLAVWTRNPTLVVSGLLLVGLLALRVHLADAETRRGTAPDGVALDGVALDRVALDRVTLDEVRP